MVVAAPRDRRSGGDRRAAARPRRLQRSHPRRCRRPSNRGQRARRRGRHRGPPPARRRRLQPGPAAPRSKDAPTSVGRVALLHRPAPGDLPRPPQGGRLRRTARPVDGERCRLARPGAPVPAGPRTARAERRRRRWAALDRRAPRPRRRRTEPDGADRRGVGRRAVAVRHGGGARGRHPARPHGAGRAGAVAGARRGRADRHRARHRRRC